MKGPKEKKKAMTLILILIPKLRFQSKIYREIIANPIFFLKKKIKKNKGVFFFIMKRR